MGIEPTPPAWKAGALPLSYTRAERFQATAATRGRLAKLVGRAGFEPAKAMPPDLQSGPVGRLGICPPADLC